MRSIRIVLTLLLALLATQANAADLWRPKGSPGFTDSNGKPLTSGKICFYDAGTTDSRTVYKDSDASEEWSQPITLDSAGKLSDPIYVGTGAFKEVLISKDATDCDSGTVLYTADDIPGAFDTDALSVDFAKPEMPVIAQAGTVDLTTDALGKLVNVDATSGATVTLPSVQDVGDGGLIAIRKSDSGGTAVSIEGSGSEKINGADTYSLAKPGESVTLVSDGAGWNVVEPLVAGSVTFSRLATSAYDNDGTLAGNSATKLPTQFAVKTYVDNAVSASIKWKEPVVAATTTAGTLASDFENGDEIDGVTLATGNRILIKDQSDGEENGIYVVGSSGAPTRATGADDESELLGATVFVEGGTTNGATQWTVTNDAITVGTTEIVFVKIAASLQYTADESTLTKDGLEFSIKDGGVSASQIASSAISTGKLDTTVSARLMPIGTVFDFAGSSCPTYSLESYGQAISRSTYSVLFGIIGTTYGTGDGSTTFNLPDARGRVVAGEDDMGGTSANRLTNVSGSLNGDTLGATGGGETFTIAQTNLPNINLSGGSHTHTFSGTTSAAGAHDHVYFIPTSPSATYGPGNQAAVPSRTSASTGAVSAHTHTFSGTTSASGALTIPLGGSGTGLSKVQPTIILRKCIETGV